MPTPQDFAYENAVLLRRFENNVHRKIAHRLALASNQLTGVLRTYDLSAVASGFRDRRVEAIIARGEAIINAAYTDVAAIARAELGPLARLQAGANRQVLADAALIELGKIRLPTPEQLRAILTFDPIEGAVMRDWWTKQRADTKVAFRAAMRDGLLKNDSTDALVRRVRGRSVAGRLRGGVMNVSLNSARRLVRTSVTHISVRAAALTYEKNRDLTDQFEIVATLDERTSEICAALDGRRFEHGNAKYGYPPYHHNCRTTIIPVINYKKLGLKESKQTRQTFPQWFKDQPKAKQDRIFGPTRGQWLREGKVTINGLVDRDFRPLSVTELANKLGETLTSEAAITGVAGEEAAWARTAQTIIGERGELAAQAGQGAAMLLDMEAGSMAHKQWWSARLNYHQQLAQSGIMDAARWHSAKNALYRAQHGWYLGSQGPEAGVLKLLAQDAGLSAGGTTYHGGKFLDHNVGLQAAFRQSIRAHLSTEGAFTYDDLLTVYRADVTFQQTAARHVFGNETTIALRRVVDRELFHLQGVEVPLIGEEVTVNMGSVSSWSLDPAWKWFGQIMVEAQVPIKDIASWWFTTQERGAFKFKLHPEAALVTDVLWHQKEVVLFGRPLLVRRVAPS